MPTPAIISLATAVPRYEYTQKQLLALSGHKGRLAEQFFFNSAIERRAFVRPIEPLIEGQPTRDELHDRFLSGALELAEDAATKAIDRAGIKPADVTLLIVTTCTGYTCPSLSSRLAARIPFNSGLQRCDLVGLGCGAALPALQRASDHVRATDGVALVISTEVCSATYYADDTDETMLANALFADGAAACVIGPKEYALTRDAPIPALMGFQTFLQPQHANLMGFTNVDGYLRILLKREIVEHGPAMVTTMVRQLMERNKLERGDINHWVIHSGGRRVIDGLVTALELPESAASSSREVLRKHGNMSAATVFFVLKEMLATTSVRDGEHGVMIALGPGFAAEGALLRWMKP